jgi:methylthioribose-1-phosphate isomerase
MIPTLAWTPEGVRFIDQTKLPLEESYVLATTYQQVADIIVTMVVRGAPAIGVSAAYGIALGVLHTTAVTPQEFAPEFDRICARLAGTRPTAVNLFWAIDRMKRLFAKLLAEGDTLAQIQEKILDEAHAMYQEDIAACKTMGAFGGALLPDEGGVLTHCNAGALATCGYAAFSARRSTHRMGTDGRRHRHDRHLRQHGSQPDARGAHSGRRGGRGPDCRQWRCGQQDRNL